MIVISWRPVLFVFLPLAAGYFLSYFFRTINALIAGALVTDLGVDASHLGLMTAVYFLTFAAVQLPLGGLLGRYGPRRVLKVDCFSSLPQGRHCSPPQIDLKCL